MMDPKEELEREEWLPLSWRDAIERRDMPAIRRLYAQDHKAWLSLYDMRDRWQSTAERYRKALERIAEMDAGDAGPAVAVAKEVIGTHPPEEP